MNDKQATDTKMICPHCWKEIDSEWEAIGNFSLAEGWTPELVAQAAQDTGLTIEARKSILGYRSSEWLSIWRQGNQDDLEAFWDRAEKLRAEASD